MFVSLEPALVILATSVAAALLALLMLSHAAGSKLGTPRRPSLAPGIEPAVFLFDDRDLVDATAPALRLVGVGADRSDTWERVLAYLSRHFDGVERHLDTLAHKGQVQLIGDRDPTLRVTAENLGAMTRITLADLKAEGQGVTIDALSLRAQEAELNDLRDITSAIPVLAWRTRTDGRIDWANREYTVALSRHLGTPAPDLAWPLHPLFGTTLPETGAARVSVSAADGRATNWYELHSTPIANGTLNFAINADATAKAEKALREFVQTLTKTFAHLPIGLAVFDHKRQLQLFNPALIDLTGLGPEFLSARPTLYAVLDRLRETRVIPEPKDYRAWRQKITDLEQAASSGFYQETWILPAGQTYRVTGRPHPDGAIAFLFEDISAETSLTRRFRSEIGRSQEVLDSLDEGIAVFSAAGALVQANDAYARLWDLDPAATLGHVTIIDALRRWQGMTLTHAIWPELREFLSDISDRDPLGATLVLQDGRALRCRFVPMSGGATLAGFTVVAHHELPHTRRALKVRRALPLGADITEDA